ncbi:MAG: hypothetical protein ABI895_16360 [Deltaproteobacteria bacterium]
MTLPVRPVQRWLPPGKDAAVVFSIDDVHPGRSRQDYDGGGDLGAGALGLVDWLLRRHPELRVTLFITADWRETRPTPSRVLSAIPLLRDRLYLAPVLPKGSRRVDRAPEFVRYVSRLPGVEVAFHGLHHIHRGPLVHVEFQRESVGECEATLREMESIFSAADWQFVRGLCPPGWNAPEALLSALQRLDYDFLASARDIRTPVATGARTAMSGLLGAPLFTPAWVGEGQGLLHFSTNFQATSPLERAFSVLDAGGLLAIKAHIIKNAHGHIALDGVDQTYFNYLDALFLELGRRYGERLWWTSMGKVARHIRETEACAAA